MVLFSSKYQKTFVVRLYMKYHSDIQLAILPMNRWQNNVQGESTWFLFANAWSVRLLDHHYCCFFCCEYLWNFFLSWHFLGKIFWNNLCLRQVQNKLQNQTWVWSLDQNLFRFCMSMWNVTKSVSSLCYFCNVLFSFVWSIYISVTCIIYYVRSYLQIPLLWKK